MNKLWTIAPALLLAIGCGQVDLADDPSGQEACHLLLRAELADEEGDAVMLMGSMLAAGREAEKATTDSIRESLIDPIEGLEQFPMADRGKLKVACDEAGMDLILESKN